MIIAFDNGVTGGIAAISRSHGKLIGACKMPVQTTHKYKEIDVRGIHLWLSEITGGNLSNADYYIEAPNNAQTKTTAASMHGSFHAIRAFLDTKFLPWSRVVPQQWQKAMLGKVPTGETKRAALAAAKLIWPEEKWMATIKCTTPHTGMIDAALIAEYIRRKSP